MQKPSITKTNKHLFIARHALALRGSPHQDHQMPLTPAGQGRAREMAGFIGEYFNKIGGDLQKWRLMCSSALRTLQTAQGIQSQLPDLGVEPLSEFYNCPAEAITQALDEVPEDVEAVIVVGHNPAVSLLAQSISKNPGIYLSRGDIIVGTVLRWQGLQAFSLLAHNKGERRY